MIERIAVIGAGQMGNGIAHVCALAGLDVRLIDVAPDRLEAAATAMRKNMDRQMRRGLIDEVQLEESPVAVSTHNSMDANVSTRNSMVGEDEDTEQFPECPKPSTSPMNHVANSARPDLR